MSTATLESPALDYAALKQRQHAVWSSGDYAILGTTLQIMGENLCEAVDVRAGSQVLDVALSTVGVMFTPNQPQAAAELLRVVRPGGRIGLACWTPEGFIGQVLKTVGRHLPAPPAGLNSPLRWGTEAGLRALFAGQRIQVTPREFMFRYESAQHWVDVFRAFYGPVHRAFAALAPDRQQQLEGEIVALLARFNRAGPESLVVPGAYLEVVITRGA